jgi:hypothetical protein
MFRETVFREAAARLVESGAVPTIGLIGRYQYRIFEGGDTDRKWLLCAMSMSAKLTLRGDDDRRRTVCDAVCFLRWMKKDMWSMLIPRCENEDLESVPKKMITMRIWKVRDGMRDNGGILYLVLWRRNQKMALINRTVLWVVVGAETVLLTRNGTVSTDSAPSKKHTCDVLGAIYSTLGSQGALDILLEKLMDW